jgi:hypothetical protein
MSMRKDCGGIYIIRGVACYVHLEACEEDYSPCADAMIAVNARGEEAL